VHDLPLSTTPFHVELLTDPDSVIRSYTLEVNPVEGSDKIELSNPDTSFQVLLKEPFRLAGVGLLKVDKAMELPLKETYGFRIMPLRAVTASHSARLSVGVTNKNVSTIDLILEHTSPKRGEQLLNTFIDKYVELNLHDKNVIADSTLAFINARLRKITDELAGVEDRISGYKRRNQLADISEQGKVLIESSEIGRASCRERR